jgi:hypothetical protein
MDPAAPNLLSEGIAGMDGPSLWTRMNSVSNGFREATRCLSWLYFGIFHPVQTLKHGHSAHSAACQVPPAVGATRRQQSILGIP